MCTPLTRDDERACGRLFELCPDFADHLLERVKHRDVRQTKIAQRVLEAFTLASLAIFEFDYFDVDYRSEFSATHETTFAVRNPATTRLHFFRGDTTGEQGMRNIAKAAARAAKAERPDEQVAATRVAPAYLGYVILRPQAPGTIGRSIIPPIAHRSVLKEPGTLGKNVRTGVSEEIDLFGVRLTARGVPFMEQDGHLLRCVHAAAWMAHYTATLRGVVARRRTAEIHRAEDDLFAMGRQYPSPGLTDEALSRVLGRIGLPTAFIDYGVLRRKRPPRWFDRKEVWRNADDEEFWVAENLTGTICRYLNSGLPVILARNDTEHAHVVCGYVRHEDLAEASEDDPDPSRVSHLIVNDDQEGPYRFEAVDAMVEALQTDPGSLTVLVPLPSGLWLSGDVAEIIAAEVVEEFAKKRLAALDEWAQAAGIESGTLAARREALESFLPQLEDLEGRATTEGESTLAIRSSALTGTDFKQGFTRLVGDQVAEEIIGFVRLPKYVWAVEILDRALRHTRNPSEPAVIATVVMDATTVVKRLSEIGALKALVVHLGGQISTDLEESASWVPVSARARFSCRWHHEREWLLEPSAIAARSKLAN